MKVAFFGTSDRSIPILEVLKNNFDLSLCITKSDVKVGRKQKTKETAVKTWAKANGVHFVTIKSINTKEASKISNELFDKNIEVGVVADFSFIIPEEVINTPKHKLVNIHFSLLPNYRGASPVQAAIRNLDDITGVTYYVMDKGMDTGPILHQLKHRLSKTETSGELYETLFDKAAQKLPNVLRNYTKGKIKPKLQNSKRATYTYSPTHPKNTFIYKEDAKIDWNKSPQKIEAEIRAYNPWPISWTTLKKLDKNEKVHSETPLIIKSGKNQNLTVKIHKARIKNERLEIIELQVEGKNKTSWIDFKNGYVET